MPLYLVRIIWNIGSQKEPIFENSGLIIGGHPTLNEKVSLESYSLPVIVLTGIIDLVGGIAVTSYHALTCHSLTDSGTL